MDEQFKEDTESHFNPVPSMFTLCNALCGFTSIIYTCGADNGKIPAISLWLICGAMLFDVFDGLAARLLKAQSLHGMNLDSMADVISFGAAPAMIIYRVVMGDDATMHGLVPGLAWFVAAYYLGCALWRLAQYNTIALQDSNDHADFVGLPSPGAAALICAMTVLVPQINGLGPKSEFVVYLAYAIASATLMISAVPYTHAMRRLFHSSRKWIAILFVTGVVVSIFLFKIWALVAWAHVYAFSAPLIALEARVMQRRQVDI